jgi:hypothetical protein
MAEFNAFCKDFWKAWVAKVLRTIISVKFLTVATIFYLSTMLLREGFISSDNWVSVIISGVVAIVLSRGAFEIAGLFKNGNHSDKNNNE